MSFQHKKNPDPQAYPKTKLLQHIGECPVVRNLVPGVKLMKEGFTLAGIIIILVSSCLKRSNFIG